MSTRKSLDATKRRSVNARVSAEEIDGVREYCEAREITVAGLIHEVIDVASRDQVPPASDYESYLSGWLTPEEFETLSELALATGLEPLAWLRLMALVAADVGRGAVLVRQIDAVRRERW